jgi:ribosome-binding protein aMBF1 (putative translation factor)
MAEKKKKTKRAARSVGLPAQPGAGKPKGRRRASAQPRQRPKRATPGSLSASLREAIRDSGMTAYQIARHARLSQIVVYRFVSGERDIRLSTADKLAEVLGLELRRRL